MSPAAVVFNNNCYVFYLNAQQNLSYKFADGTSWSQDQRILASVNPPYDQGTTGPMSLSPSAVVWNNVIYVYFQHGALPEYVGSEAGNPGDGGLFVVYSKDGTHWENVDDNQQPTAQLQNVGMSFSPSAVVWRNMIHVFHMGSDRDFQLWYSYHDGQNWHPDQPVPDANGNPVVIGDPGDIWNNSIGTGDIAPMSPAAVVFNNNCYVFYLNAQQNLSYKFANGTIWSPEAPVPDVPSQCGYVGCVVF